MPQAQKSVKSSGNKYVCPRTTYVIPPPCKDPGCANAEEMLRMPLESYFVCKDCVAASPCAFSTGWARRPMEYYTNVKPWGNGKRKSWTQKTNAVLLLAHILERRTKTLGESFQKTDKQ